MSTAAKSLRIKDSTAHCPFYASSVTSISILSVTARKAAGRTGFADESVIVAGVKVFGMVNTIVTYCPQPCLHLIYRAGGVPAPAFMCNVSVYTSKSYRQFNSMVSTMLGRV